MNQQPGFRSTGAAQVEAGAARVLPPVERLNSDACSVPVPIPHNPLRYTLTYLVSSGDGWLVIDPDGTPLKAGTRSPPGWPAQALGVDDVRGVVVTLYTPTITVFPPASMRPVRRWQCTRPKLTRSPKASPAARPPRRSRNGGSASVVCPRKNSTPRRPSSGEPINDGSPTRWAQPDVLLEDGDFAPSKRQRLRAVWTPGYTARTPVPAGRYYPGALDRRPCPSPHQPEHRLARRSRRDPCPGQLVVLC